MSTRVEIDRILVTGVDLPPGGGQLRDLLAAEVGERIAARQDPAAPAERGRVTGAPLAPSDAAGERSLARALAARVTAAVEPGAHR